MKINVGSQNMKSMQPDGEAVRGKTVEEEEEEEEEWRYGRKKLECRSSPVDQTGLVSS